eukprot:2541732-Pleurochrysis_carterae.AAC.1
MSKAGTGYSYSMRMLAWDVIDKQSARLTSAAWPASQPLSRPGPESDRRWVVAPHRRRFSRAQIRVRRTRLRKMDCFGQVVMKAVDVWSPTH